MTTRISGYPVNAIHVVKIVMALCSVLLIWDVSILCVDQGFIASQLHSVLGAAAMLVPMSLVSQMLICEEKPITGFMLILFVSGLCFCGSGLNYWLVPVGFLLCVFFRLVVFRVWPMGDRAESRVAVFWASITVFLFALVYAAALFVRYSHSWDYSSILVSVAGFTFMHIATMWLHMVLFSMRNQRIFSRVMLVGSELSEKAQDNIGQRSGGDVVPERRKPSLSEVARYKMFGIKPNLPDGTVESFFLNMLLKPDRHLVRIRETVEPRSGSYHVRTTYEVSVPRAIGRKYLELLLPVAVHRKGELTYDLQPGKAEGLSVRRLGVDETQKYLTKAMKYVLNYGGVHGDNSHKLAARISGLVVSEEPGDSYDREAKDILSQMRSGGSDPFVDGVVEFLLDNYRYVAPICLSVERGCSTRGFGSVVSLNMQSSPPLVPVRESGGPRRRLFNEARRMFITKKRMHYYFGLGNADRTKSYHLTFRGPEGAYVSDVGFRFAGGKHVFATAEKTTLSARYDDECVRLFVRGGRGFNQAAVEVGFDDRSHRALQTQCAASVVALCLMLYLGSTFGLVAPPCHVGATDVMLPLMVLTVAGLVSAWEGMGRRRAEEWLWTVSSAGAVLSAIAMLDLIAKIYLKIPIGQEVQTPLWVFMMTLSFGIALLSCSMLFKKVKQHGIAMSAVPHTRAAGNERQFARDYRKMLKEWRLALGDPGSGDHGGSDAEAATKNDAGRSGDSDANHADSLIGGEASVVLPGEKARHYDADMKVYGLLYDRMWPDGWLIPAWAGAMDAFGSRTNYFLAYLEQVMELGRSSGAELEETDKSDAKKASDEVDSETREETETEKEA